MPNGQAFNNTKEEIVTTETFTVNRKLGDQKRLAGLLPSDPTFGLYFFGYTLTPN